MISRETIRDFFRSNKEQGTDLRRDMLWGYFFTDTHRKKLTRLRPILQALGYRYVGILDPLPDDDAQDVYFLHVERVETHTAESLFRRCAELDEFARERGLRTFDGFDVGNVDGSVLGPADE